MTNQDRYFFVGVAVTFFISVWGYDNTEFHCWLLDDANKNNEFNCENVEFVWVNDPPKALIKDEFFTVEYELRFNEDGGYEKFLGWLIENGWMDYANGNVTTAKEFCAAECADGGVAEWNMDYDVDNCCVHHINVHTCLEDAILAHDDVCGPWVMPSGSAFIHTPGMATPIQKWTSEVVLAAEGTNIIIAHIRIGAIQMALTWKMIVYSPARDWTAVGERNVYIDHHIQDNPLQILTDSVVGSGDLLWVAFRAEDGIYGAGIYVEFTAPPVYTIGHCTTGRVIFTAPEEQVRTWTITKTNTSVILVCNGVEIVNYLLSESTSAGCVPQWSTDAVKMKFISNSNGIDTASDEYRAKPTVCTSLPERWTGLTTETDFPIFHDTSLAVSCQEGYKNTGSDVITCNTYRYDDYSYSVEPQCVSVWTAVGERNVHIDYDIEHNPLQISTDSVVGSNDLLWVAFHKAGGNAAGEIKVTFTAPPSYQIVWCTGWVNFALPEEHDDITWTITETDTSLMLTCNGVEIVNYLFSESTDDNCVSRWSTDTVKMKFKLTDTASDEYRLKHTVCTRVSERWTGLTAETVDFPISHNTTLAVSCQEGYKNTGSDVLTCNTYLHDDYSYNVEPQCVLDSVLRRSNVTLTQSSTLTGTGAAAQFDYAASSAMDSDFSTFSHTDTIYDLNPWFMVEFTDGYLSIAKVVIYNRNYVDIDKSLYCGATLNAYESDDCVGAINNLIVNLFANNDLVKTCGTITGNTGTSRADQTYTIECGNSVGDAIKFSKTERSVITILELEIYVQPKNVTTTMDHHNLTTVHTQAAKEHSANPEEVSQPRTEEHQSTPIKEIIASSVPDPGLTTMLPTTATVAGAAGTPNHEVAVTGAIHLEVVEQLNITGIVITPSIITTNPNSSQDCGDKYCDEQTEDCETCPRDCCPRLKHEMLIIIIAILSCLLVLALILIPITVWYYKKQILDDNTQIIDGEKQPLLAS